MNSDYDKHSIIVIIAFFAYTGVILPITAIYYQFKDTCSSGSSNASVININDNDNDIQVKNIVIGEYEETSFSNSETSVSETSVSETNISETSTSTYFGSEYQSANSE